MKKRNWIYEILINLDLLVTGAALIWLIIITFGGVIMRYWLKNPLIWQEEVQIWCFLWITFLGAGAAFRYDNHVSIEILVDMFPKTAQKIIEGIIYIVMMLLLGYMFMKGLALVQQLNTTGRFTNILKVPYVYLYGAMPVGCVLMMINYTVVILHKLFGIGPGRAVTEGEADA